MPTAQEPQGDRFPDKPNILLIITDQEREVMHWPEGWAEANLPARARLMAHGLHFTNAYCNATTCSPSRATLLTGRYPAQHGVKTLLQNNRPRSKAQNRLTTLPPDLPNLARMLEEAGYDVVYKGKFHLSRPVHYNATERRRTWSEADVTHIAETYGFHGWNPPDASDPKAVTAYGGGAINNDGRFVDGDGTALGRKVHQDEAYNRSAVGFLDSYTGERPFCLIVSLVGPHDVQAYPGRGLKGLGRSKPRYVQGGYDLDAFQYLPIDPPPTVDEAIAAKPPVHRAIQRLFTLGAGACRTRRQQRTYARFYAYLCREVDRQILKILEALDANGLTEETLIVRTSDHGELAMAHGGMREKFYNVYRETVNVPLIISYPQLFPEARSTGALASLVDIMPTLATLTGVREPARYGFQGHDLTPILAHASSTVAAATAAATATQPASSVQDYVHVTAEDDTWPVRGASCIRAIIEQDWKYAVYYDPATGADPVYEMYDLRRDPLETTNLAHEEHWQPAYAAERARLHQRLSEVMAQHGTTPTEIRWPSVEAFAPEIPYKKETRRLYASEIIIEAPVATVWETFTDQEHLGDWNPLLLAIEGCLGLGERIQVQVANLPQPAEAHIVRYNPPYDLAWLDHVPGGAMTPRFSVNLEPLDDARTRFTVQESFEGTLVRVVGRHLDQQMRRRYAAMCQALKERVETDIARTKGQEDAYD